MTNPVSGGDSFHSRALILHPKFQKQAKYDALVKRSFELQKAEVRLFPLVGRISVLACDSGKGVLLKTLGVRAFIPEEAIILLRNFSRLTCANQYLSELRKCDHFSGVILVGSGIKPFIKAAFQPTTMNLVIVSRFLFLPDKADFLFLSLGYSCQRGLCCVTL